MAILCPECKGLGAHSYECNRCNGTGIYINPITKAPSGKCRQCGGSGRFIPQWKANPDYPLKTFRLPFISVTLASGTEILAYRCRVCRGRKTVEASDVFSSRNAG